MSDSHHEERLQRIREIAYDLWEKEGCPEGREHEFWLRAEAMVDAEPPSAMPAAKDSGQERKVNEASDKSFPASDPPAFTASKAAGTKAA